MKYKVHRIEVRSKNMQQTLEEYLNKLHGEIISVVPDVRPTFMMMGATSRVEYLLIVEKTR
jgi:hypothetical protein